MRLLPMQPSLGGTSRNLVGVVHGIVVVDEAKSPAPRETPGLVASSTTDHLDLATNVHGEPLSGGLQAYQPT